MAEHKMKSEKASEEEINRLRSQVRQLQAELSRRGRDVEDEDEEREERGGRARGSRSGREARNQEQVDETFDVLRDLPVRFMDETSKLVRGLTFAYLEQVRMAADVMNTFVDEVLVRNQPTRSSSSEDEGTESRRRGTRRRPR